MAEAPFVPPPRKPVSTFPTPSHVVSMYTELVNRDDPAYKANAPVKRGSIYSTMVGAKPEVISQFPLLYFLRERQFQGNDQLVFWDWINDEQAHDTYNSQDSYALESIQHPGFQREYTIRRDEYNDEPAIALGLPLNTLVAVRIVDGGGNYTQATGTITGTTVAIDFVVLDGVIISGVVTDQGEGILGTYEITVTGDGAGAIVEPIVQSTASVLVGQKKVELDPQDPLQHEFIKLVRIYQTLPGPTIYSTRTDEDGAEVTIATTAKIAATIIPREFINVSTWFKVNRQQQDNVYVANEVVESRTVHTTTSDPDDDHTTYSSRLDSDGIVVTIASTLSDRTAITPGETLNGSTWTVTSSQAVSDLVAKMIVETRLVNTGNFVPSTRLDEDGFKVTIIRTLDDLTLITTQEQILSNNWVKTTIDPVSLRLHSDELSDLVGWAVVETRLIPGDPVPATRLDEDGVAVTVSRRLKDLTTITTTETLVGITWTKVTSEKVTELVSWEVTEVRTIPGNPIPSTKLDKDSDVIEIVRTMKASASIVTQEVIIGPNLIKTTSDQITDLVSWELVEARPIPGNSVPSSRVDQDHETVNIHSRLRAEGSITPGASEGGGFLTTVEGKEVTDLVSEEITTTKRWLDEALYVVSIENLIPREFRAFIPTVVESHTVVGTASQPTLGTGQFEISEKQLTKIFKEVRTTTLGSVSLPITHVNQELTELYGGGVLNVTYTLEVQGTGTIDEGLTITTSTLTDLGNGMEIKQTNELNVLAWPQLTGQDYDERLDVLIPFTQQVVTPGTGISVPQTDVKPIDQWREEDRTIDATAAAAVLDAYLLTYPSKINVDMPDKLEAVFGVIESAAGEGTDTQTGSIFVSGNYSVSQSLSASAQSSVTLSPDVVLTVKQFWGNNIDSTHYHFFLINPVTSTDVLNKINAILASPVSDWPKFNPQIVTLLTYGEKRSLQVRATSQGSQAVSGSGNSSTAAGGVGYSIEVGSTFRTVRISPTIHPSINLTGTTSDSRGISASAFSEAEGLGPAESISQSDTASANITPTTIDATVGTTDWPTTGLYLYRVDAQPYRYGYVQFHVVIVDAADFPINP